MENPPLARPTPSRKEWREDFIRRQLEGLRRLGLSPEALKREEALLRGGMATSLLADEKPAP